MAELPAVRRAYELGRLRTATGEAALATLLPLAVRAAGHAVPLGLLPVFFAAVLLLRWTGRAWGRAALFGTMAGALPLFIPVAACLACQGGCPPWCQPLCATTGLCAGLFFGRLARGGGLPVIATGTGVAVLVGALGCTAFGASTVIGMAAALVVGAAAGSLRLRPA